MSFDIPAQNVYYLLLYAWDKFPEGRSIDVGNIKGPALPNLLANVLLSCVKKLLRRGLERNYKPFVEDLPGPRGQFLLDETIKKGALLSGKITCAFDELNIDTHPNRILKAVIKYLSRAPEIDRILSSELVRVAKKLTSVSDMRVSRGIFRSVQLGKSNGQYGLAMQVCRLAVDIALPEEKGAKSRFIDLLRDEVRMSSIFECFVRNFYRSSQADFTANAEHVKWIMEGDDEMIRFLPEMRTDITLRSDKRTIVIDTKYYAKTLVSRFDGGQLKVRSGHLYQIQTYLRSMHYRSGPDSEAEGILLYPSIGGQSVRIDLLLNGYRTRVWTIDLAQSWEKIHSNLLELIAN